ncbi:universal stress protein [Arenibacter certesii]|uniref:UspA domain-containing protein n=1 Tax=Arenibacter certesii TaxID=228955 RepID=A0A918MN46_9FLAO|nr:universal stress protein [Arenibacter certesii]GGW42642.1 hypothetical protein GCM10007383_29060 [Arenibacter certesii]
MKNILIPTDLSQNSCNALAYTIKLFGDNPVNFYVVYVDNLAPSEVVGNTIILPAKKQLEYSGTKEKLKAFMVRVAGLSTFPGHQFIAMHFIGNRISNLRKIVAEKKIDFIALGIENCSTVKSSDIGNNTWEIITKIACNTLIIPENALITFPKQIIFPTNYHIFFSHKILQSFTEILELSKSKLQVLNILSSKIKPTSDQENNRIYFEDYLEESYQNGYFLHTTHKSDVCTAIERYLTNHDADMVVLVARNLNFMHKLFFHTTPLQLLHPLPILVLHE